MTRQRQKTKRGMTSIVITMIVIIILGIITLGFTRLMLSQATQTTNNDLSQSAYDSALAGVEDAKISVIKYHQCLNKGYSISTGTEECKFLIKTMQEGIKKQDCDVIKKALKREDTSTNADGTTNADSQGVIIQETQRSSEDQSKTASDMVQAYTCVTVKEELSDYKTSLSENDRVRLIPLRVNDTSSKIAAVEFNWYSNTNLEKDGGVNRICNNPGSGDTKNKVLDSKTSCITPAVIVSMFQFDSSFALSELSTARTAGTDRGTLFLRPLKSNSSNTVNITGNDWLKSADKNENLVKKVNCKFGDTYACKTKLEFPNTFQGNGVDNKSGIFLLVSLPYGASTTDLSIKMLDKNGNTLWFNGVQARVDSTGRANDLYRRVETRLDLNDTNFPYPEFEITMGGNGDIRKSFYVTNNCWSSNNGVVAPTCADTGNSPSGF